jgi:hypothetical protein
VLLLNQMLHLVQGLSCLLLPLLCLMKLVLHVSLAFLEITEQGVGLLTLDHLLVVPGAENEAHSGCMCG